MAKQGVLIDLTKCMGCDSCVVACKLYNNNKWIEDRHPFPIPATGQNARLADENWTVVKKRRISTVNRTCGETGTQLQVGQRIPVEVPVQRNGTEEWRFVKWQCLHCKQPACVSSCFATSFRKKENGAILYYPLTCVGCRYCMLACPFSIPMFEWDNPLPMLTKCSFCNTRMEEGDAPACVVVCPTDVMTFGQFEDEFDADGNLISEGVVLRKARETIANELICANGHRCNAKESGLSIGDVCPTPGCDRPLSHRYVQHIYGEKEVGGTLWIYISDRPFASLGFRTMDCEVRPIPERPLPDYTKQYMFWTPILGGIWAVVLGILYLICNRKSAKHDVIPVDDDEDES